jgi:hypothetical protein
VDSDSDLESLTPPDYAGKKYYFGWGEYLSGSMGNETRYDVLHTHNLFTQGIGGDYIGTKLINRNFGGREIRSNWSAIKSEITSDDMYLQYSSGHGYSEGLGVGVSYDEIRDNCFHLKFKPEIPSPFWQAVTYIRRPKWTFQSTNIS